MPTSPFRDIAESGFGVMLWSMFSAVRSTVTSKASETEFTLEGGTCATELGHGQCARPARCARGRDLQVHQPLPRFSPSSSAISPAHGRVGLIHPPVPRPARGLLRSW